MRYSTLVTLSFCALGGLVLAVSGWWYASAFLSDRASTYTQMKDDAKQSTEQDTADTRLAELARTTADGRARLIALSGADVLVVAKTIESVGTIAHVDLRVTGASLASAPSKVATSSLRTIIFSFEAQGAFARVVRALELLAQIPLPSTIDQLDMTKSSPDSTNKTPDDWRASGRIRLLTNATSTP